MSGLISQVVSHRGGLIKQAPLNIKENNHHITIISTIQTRDVIVYCVLYSDHVTCTVSMVTNRSPWKLTLVAVDAAVLTVVAAVPGGRYR